MAGSANSSNDAAQNPSDVKFFIVIAVLLVTISALLAMLWYRAHMRALQSEKLAVQMRQDQLDARQRLDQLQFLQAMLSQKVLGPALAREQLATMDVVLDGQQRSALCLSTEQAQAIGLKAGDVVMVMDHPSSSSAPTTKPSSRPK
jgi:cell division protein FtsL